MKRKTVRVELPAELAEEIEKLAPSVPVSVWVRFALREAVKEERERRRRIEAMGGAETVARAFLCAVPLVGRGKSKQR